MFMALRVTWSTCYSWLQKSDLQLARVQVNYSHILSLLFSVLDNFLFDPILHHAYRSWMKETMTKTIGCLWDCGFILE